MLVKLIIAAIVVLPAVLLIASALRGRTQVRSCCSVPAEQDGRMRDAYADVSPSAPPAP